MNPLNPNNNVPLFTNNPSDPYGAMHTQYVPAITSWPGEPVPVNHFGWPSLGAHYIAPGYVPHVTGSGASDVTTGVAGGLDPWFSSLSVNLSNDIIGHFMAVMPALMTLFGILVGTTVIVVIYRFLTSKL